MYKTEGEALNLAVFIGLQSPCAKSKRGAVIFHREKGCLGTGFNAQPGPFVCNGSVACRAHCNKLCVHAEVAALHAASRNQNSVVGAEIVHVKIVNATAVASGPPSCWQCSREVLESGIEWFWLLHEDGLKRYSAEEFHEQTLCNLGLPVFR
jgi:deoxycytidylate deaminase